jgi:hypothetical protein
MVMKMVFLSIYLWKSDTQWEKGYRKYRVTLEDANVKLSLSSNISKHNRLFPHAF